MKQVLKLLAVGLLPFAGGGVCYLLILLVVALMFIASVLFIVPIAIVFVLGFLFLWTFVCYKASNRDMNVLTQVALLNTVGVIMLILRVVFAGSYEGLGYIASLIFAFPAEMAVLFVGSIVQIPAYIVYCLLLIATSTAGVLLKAKRPQKEKR